MVEKQYIEKTEEIKVGLAKQAKGEKLTSEEKAAFKEHRKTTELCRMAENPVNLFCLKSSGTMNRLTRIISMTTGIIFTVAIK